MAEKKKPRRRSSPAIPPATASSPAGDAIVPKFPVVGMVASAGGLDAFKMFFKAMPPDSGLAFVLVPHLDPTHPSLMVELLAKYTAMPVAEAVEGMRIAPNQVTIIPPNKYLALERGVLRLKGPVMRDGIQAIIDGFLRSLAEDQQEKAIGIILSGTGSHGTLGLKAIKAAGGMVLVQDPKSAEFDQMPLSAVASGLADFVLPPQGMPAALVSYVRHSYVNGGTPAEAAEKSAEYLNRILALLCARSKHDFRCYRKKMATRRIERRMGLNQIHELPEYLAYLNEHPEECQQLVKDLLISVTSFFRDPEAFQILQAQAIAPLVQGKEARSAVRVWIPGCATGEEAYSISMLILERVAGAQKHCPLQVFATDLDEDALNIARQGIYPASIVADVPRERLDRFFTRVDEQTYQINKELRESVVFAGQNLVGDAPFSKLDLISCRNLLIYLEPEIQQKVLHLFHFALLEGGFLFLGSSETIGPLENLFAPISKKWRLFRRIEARQPTHVEFPIKPAGASAYTTRSAGPAAARTISYADMTERILLENFAPASVLVNAKHEILYLHGPTARYLNLPSGEATLNVLELAREGLRTQLRAALYRAAKTQKQIVLNHVRAKREKTYAPVRLTVKPLSMARADDNLVLVIFEEAVRAEAPAAPKHGADESIVRQLEDDLKTTREELQASIEQFDSANEEMKASNEEMMSMNEELQSANEELETSKEELQSLNEELNTVNNQLQDKVQELEGANNDLTNLLNTTDLATIFLDRHSHIKRFTPASRTLFNLIGTDTGRPVGDITLKFIDPDLRRDTETVLHDLSMLEKEVTTADGRWYMRRILPYRTLDNRIEGVVLTFADVTELKRAELSLRQDKELRRLATVLLDSNDAVTVHDFLGNISSWNRAAERMYGYTEQEATGMNIAQITPADQRKQNQSLIDAVRRNEREGPLELRRQRKDGAILDVSLSATLLRDESGQAIAVATTERDITQRKQLEKEVLEIAALEQQRIGQELHDNTGQELTALALVAESLAETLKAEDAPDAELAAKVATGIKRALGQVRTFARGLIPVEVDTQGLASALQNFAARISGLQQAGCTFVQEQPVPLEDHQAATQLFRIAQEAVANALQHGQARHITILLGQRDGHLSLRIQDDGVGMPAKLPDLAGMGMRIMQYRADLIRARLDVERGPSGGTQVICTLA
jgi:two-component system, chemotaxis family, CheB/CheR fusion protein